MTDIEFERQEVRREAFRQAQRDEYQKGHPRTRRSTRLRTDITPELDPDDWSVHFACLPPRLGWDDPEAFTTMIHIGVHHNTHSPDAGKSRDEPVGAGKAALFHMNFWRRAGGVPLDFAFDGQDSDIYNYLVHIYDKDGFVRPELVGYEMKKTPDALVLLDLKIDKAHRGKRLGLQAIQQTLMMFGRGTIAYMIANPTEPKEQVPLKSRRKLARYYAQVPGLRIVEDGTRLICLPGWY